MNYEEKDKMSASLAGISCLFNKDCPKPESSDTRLNEPDGKKLEKKDSIIQSNKDLVRISVRNLVEFIFRSGDIDNRRTGVKEKQAMEAGSRLHRKIQRQMGSSYQSEVSLKNKVEFDTFFLQIEGRADGIFSKEMGEKEREAFLEEVFGISQKEQNNCALNTEKTIIEEKYKTTYLNEFLKIPDNVDVIDEIKGIYRDPRKMKEPVPVHKAQAMCYAYIYALQENKPIMGVQMTYCNLETEEIKRFYDCYTFAQLKEWFRETVNSYEKWVLLELQMKRELKNSLKGMEFPFPYRPGQRKLAVSVYRSIARKAELFIQAPTGIGKTMSVIFPALKAMGEGHGDRVFYLTAKTITRTVAEEALDILRKNGLKLHSVTITAKEKICPLDSCICNPEHCSYAKGHFERVNEALYDALTHKERMGRDTVLEYAMKHQVCPFEFNLDLTLWSQAIICDYNYVFDPNVYLRRFFGDSVQGDYIFLVDEAHNLPDRAREMYSARLVKEEVLKAEKIFRACVDFPLLDTPDAIHAAEKTLRALRKLNKRLLVLKKMTDELMLLDEIDDLYEDALHTQECISTYLEETRNTADEELLEFYFDLRHFTAISEIVNDAYIPYCSVEGTQFQVKLFCANPAENLHNCTQRGISTVFFSATMLPMHYYKQLLTTEENAYAIYVDSPFDNKRRLLAIAEDVSSRYTMRNRIQYGKVLDYIIKAAQAKCGNYMVFFPSYRYMVEVVTLYRERFSKDEDAPFQILIQEQGMSEENRDAFLQQFMQAEQKTQTLSGGSEIDKKVQPVAERFDLQKNTEQLPVTEKKSLVGFCVIGGIFSEGIDLTGQQLIGALVVGTGLAQISTEGELLKNYFQEKGQNGYDYAYRFPGINKVFQAAGRVIRQAEDEGIVLLLDNRLLTSNHVELFPMDWENYREVTLDTVENMVKAFWER